MYELIQRMESVFYKMILPDIEKAMNENVSIGTFILTACLIDYLAGFRYCKDKDSNRKAYKDFVNNYFDGKYNGEDLYVSLRCKLVHNYSEGGKYIFINNHPKLHRTICKDSNISTNNNKIFLNLENFVNDIKIAMDKYFNELKESDDLKKDAKLRIDTLSILGKYEFGSLKNDNNNYSNPLIDGDASTKY